jgi:hypothetical protein
MCISFFVLALIIDSLGKIDHHHESSISPKRWLFSIPELSIFLFPNGHLKISKNTYIEHKQNVIMAKTSPTPPKSLTRKETTRLKVRENIIDRMKTTNRSPL